MPHICFDKPHFFQRGNMLNKLEYLVYEESKFSITVHNKKLFWYLLSTADKKTTFLIKPRACERKGGDFFVCYHRLFFAFLSPDF